MTYEIRKDFRYTEEHEWISADGKKVRFGMSDYAQHELGDLVYIDIPGPGTHIKIGEEIGSMESVKSIEPIYAPVTGTILEINPVLTDRADIINESPYEEGWLAVIEIDDPKEIDGLINSDEYDKKINQ